MDQNRDQDNNLFDFDNQPQEPAEDQPVVSAGGARSYPVPPELEPELQPIEPPPPGPEYLPPPPVPAQPPPRSNMTWLLVAIIVLVVLCCCCIAAVLLMYFVLGDPLLCLLNPAYCP